MAKSIKNVVDNALCTACGGCAAVCPKNAITMRYNEAGFLKASIDDNKCTNCGLCYNICPSNQDKIEYNGQDIFHGDMIKAYIGYSKDEIVRKKSQSGGIVTALLLYMIDQGMVEGAVVNQFDSEAKRPKVVFASTKDEVIKGCGSYYAQSAVANTAIEYAKEQDVAAVVLGCQAESIKKINEKYRNVKLPAYLIGLVCAGQNSGYMIDDLIKSSKYNKKEKIISFRFRDKFLGNWPGNVGIYTNKNTYQLNKQKRHEIKSIYESYRCILCFDQMNIFSDIVVGDPWGIDRTDIKKGYSVFITRTKKGQHLVEKAIKDGAIIAEEIPTDEIIKGQTVDGRHKTKFFTSKEVCIQNNWMWSYKEDFFNNSHYKGYSKGQIKRMSKRLKKARQFYLANNKGKIFKVIKNTKRKIFMKSIFYKPIFFFKRGLNYIKKNLTNKKNKK